jgi:hypothetical protein
MGFNEKLQPPAYRPGVIESILKFKVNILHILLIDLVLIIIGTSFFINLFL